jgi:membrane protease YdiL (CAAX protease family)
MAAAGGNARTPWRGDGLALLVAMTFPSLMSWIEFWDLPGAAEGRNPALGVVFGLGKLAQFAFPWIYVWWVEPGELQPPRPHLRGIGVGVCFALVVAAGTFGLYFGVLKDTPAFADTPRKLAELLVKFHANTPGVFFAMAIFISLIHSLLEEYYWRWFVFGRLKRHLPLGAAIGISSLAFMAHHVFILAYYFPGQFWSIAVPFSLGVAGGGVAWAWLYHRYRSLYAPWISHLLADAAIMVVGYDMVSRYWQP